MDKIFEISIEVIKISTKLLVIFTEMFATLTETWDFGPYVWYFNCNDQDFDRNVFKIWDSNENVRDFMLSLIDFHKNLRNFVWNTLIVQIIVTFNYRDDFILFAFWPGGGRFFYGFFGFLFIFEKRIIVTISYILRFARGGGGSKKKRHDNMHN